MIRVSVVVPVYGCEAFLPDCIASLRAQTLRDLELIFVCDASPDGSLELLRQAEREDARIRVIAFEENRGVSAARNAGIEAARGEFIGFCDGDDWVEPQMFERLYALAQEKQADAVFCRVFKDREDEKGVVTRRENVPLGFETGTRFDRAAIRETLIPAMLSRETDSDELPLSGYTPRNLFRASLAKGRRFREDIRYAEDLLYIVECMLDAGAAVTLNRDDPTFLDGLTLTEELRRAASFGAMTGEELLNCQRTAVRAAFCAEETKAALLAALADFEARL